MVVEEFCDFRDGQICFDGQRCLLCGEIVDQVILNHRQRRPDPRSRHKAQLGRTSLAVE